MCQCQLMGESRVDFSYACEQNEECATRTVIHKICFSPQESVLLKATKQIFLRLWMDLVPFGRVNVGENIALFVLSLFFLLLCFLFFFAISLQPTDVVVSDECAPEQTGSLCVISSFRRRALIVWGTKSDLRRLSRQEQSSKIRRCFSLLCFSGSQYYQYLSSSLPSEQTVH